MKFKLFIGVLLILSQGISFAAGNTDMKLMIDAMEKDNPEQFKSVLKDFISAAKSDDIKKMIELTSNVTKNKMGIAALESYFKNDAARAIRACKSISKGGEVIRIKKEQTGTGSGWVYRKICKFSEDKSVKFQFIILNESGHIALTSVSVIP